MALTTRSMAKSKVISFSLVSLVLVAFLLEITSRFFWFFWQRVPFFQPEEVAKAIVSAYYPNLKEIEWIDVRKDDEYFDILLLGGSVVNRWYSNIEVLLQKQLVAKSKGKVRIHNVSFPGHTTMDSYNKYVRLSEKEFDVVVIYHGINDVKANNAPPSIFKADYSHYVWYEGYKDLVQNPSPIVSVLVFPYTIRFAVMKLKERLPLRGYIPRFDGRRQKEWYKYGDKIRTAGSFRKNLVRIIEIARTKEEPVLLMSFASYVPNNYSREAFDAKTLDYVTEHGPIDYTPSPVEAWGLRKNVIKGITVHNHIIRDLSVKYDHVSFVDQEKLIPQRGLYFTDICHLSGAGIERFVDNMLNVVLQKMMVDDGSAFRSEVRSVKGL